MMYLRMFALLFLGLTLYAGILIGTVRERTRNVPNEDDDDQT